MKDITEEQMEAAVKNARNLSKEKGPRGAAAREFLDAVGENAPSPSGPPPKPFSPEEQRIADYLEQNTGLKATPNPLEGVPGAGRQGDALIAGGKYEFKTLDPGATANTVKNVVNNSIRKGDRQAIL